MERRLWNNWSLWKSPPTAAMVFFRAPLNYVTSLVLLRIFCEQTVLNSCRPALGFRHCDAIKGSPDTWPEMVPGAPRRRCWSSSFPFQRKKVIASEPQQLARGWGRFLVKCLAITFTHNLSNVDHWGKRIHSTWCVTVDVGFFASSWMTKDLCKFVIIFRWAYWYKWREQDPQNHLLWTPFAYT